LCASVQLTFETRQRLGTANKDAAAASFSASRLPEHFVTSSNKMGLEPVTRVVIYGRVTSIRGELLPADF
jgi:hypothetical protein